jgi:molecular chaperone GrpE
MKGGFKVEDKDITTEEILEENVELEEDANEVEDNFVTDSEDETASDEPKNSKSFFKKDKKEKKDKKDTQIEELNDRLIRTMAEFDNFRKRSEKEKSQMYDIGARAIVEKVLPVVDNFERGLSVLSEEEKEGAFAQGMEKIYKQLLSTLTEAGLVQIEAVGKEFDPNFHNAVMHAEDEELGENIVAEEFLKGYTFKDTVVRHSMVKVVN